MANLNPSIEVLLEETWYETIELKDKMETVCYVLDKVNNKHDYNLLRCEYRSVVEVCHNATNGIYKCRGNLSKVIRLGYDSSSLLQVNNTYIQLCSEISMMIPKIKNAKEQNDAELDKAEQCSCKIVNLLYMLEGIIGKMCGKCKIA